MILTIINSRIILISLFVVLLLLLLFCIISGLEPTTIISKNYPDAGTCRNRPIEGFYLLKQLPSVGEAEEYIIPPLELANECIADMDGLKQRIVQHASFHPSIPERKHWLTW